MNVQGFLGMFGDGLYHWHAKTDVGHENTVHDVKMEPMGCTRIHKFNIALEVGKISGQDGRGEEMWHATNVHNLC